VLHKTVYTAYDAAQTLKKNLSDIAKNLLIETDRAYILAIVPADKRIDLAKLKKALGAKKVSIPKEEAMIKILKFKGAGPSSFGKVHQVETWVDKALNKAKDVVLSTGSATDSVVMKIKDFIDMEEAKMANFAMAGGYKKPKMNKAAKKKLAKKVVKKSIKKPIKKVTKKIIKKVAKKIVKKTIKKVVTKKKK